MTPYGTTRITVGSSTTGRSEISTFSTGTDVTTSSEMTPDMNVTSPSSTTIGSTTKRSEGRIY